MKNIFFAVSLLLLVFLFFGNSRVSADSSGFTFKNATQRTTSVNYKNPPQFQELNNKIYYVWDESDGAYSQIWTAVMNSDGTGWSATKRTTSAFNKDTPQLQVSGNKIFYVWNANDLSYYQIWTGEMNIDGTGWTATKRTSTNLSKSIPQFQVVNNEIHYFWFESWVATYQVWTAKMNIDGTGWTATQQTTTSNAKDSPKLHVVNNVIYYVWDEYDTTNVQIWTGEMNTDGTGWSATKRTTSNYGKSNPELQVVGSKIYYTWHESDGQEWQIWTGEMNTDGTGWSATKRTTSNYSQISPQLQVVGDKIYYTWFENQNHLFVDPPFYQIWTGEMNTDGTGWTAIKRATSNNSDSPELQIDDTRIYYIWMQSDGTRGQIWTADGNYFQTQDESADVTATIPSSLSLTIDGINSGIACSNSGGNAAVDSTATTIPFGLYTGAQTKIACQTLTVSTNATDGYVVTLQQDEDLTSTGGDIMSKFSGTYGTPTIWSSPSGGVNSYFGFTTSDTDYSSFQTARYSGIASNNTGYAIARSIGPVSGEVNTISYQLEINNDQDSGVYSNNIMYIATGTF